MDSLRFLVSSLLAQLPQDSPAVIVVKPETPQISVPNGHGARSKGPSYDPMVVYILEFATILALRDEKTVEALGKDVGEALQAIIRNAANVHPIVVSRATFYLLSLLNASHVGLVCADKVVSSLISSRSIHSFELPLSCMQYLALTSPRDSNPRCQSLEVWLLAWKSRAPYGTR